MFAEPQMLLCGARTPRSQHQARVTLSWADSLMILRKLHLISHASASVRIQEATTSFNAACPEICMPMPAPPISSNTCTHLTTNHCAARPRLDRPSTTTMASTLATNARHAETFTNLDFPGSTAPSYSYAYFPLSYLKSSLGWR